MKQVKRLFIGIFFTIIGLTMFLQNLTFKDPSNTGFLGTIFGAIMGETSPKAISGTLFVVIFIMLLLFAFSPNGWTLGGLMISIVVTVLVIVGSMDITIADMSGLKLGIIVTFILVGIGLTGGAIVKLTVDGRQSYTNS